MARDFDVPVEILTPAEFGDLWPAAVTDDLVGAVHLPHRRHGEPRRRRARAREGGEGRGRPVRARRDRHRVRARGRRGAGHGRRDRSRARSRPRPWCWPPGCGPASSRGSPGASVALYPAEHVWVMTEDAEGARERVAVPARPRRLPLHPPLPRPLRDRARSSRTASRGPPTSCPPPASSSSDPTGITSRRCWRTRDSACPSWRRSGSATTCGRPRASRPTPNFQLGEFPEVPGLFVAAGFNSQGIIFGPGAGMALAEWIVEGHPTDGPHRGRRRADGPVGQRRAAGCANARSSRSAACTRCTGPASSRSPRAACAGSRCATGCARPAPRSGRPPAGSARTGSSPARSTPRSRYDFDRAFVARRRCAKRCAPRARRVALYDLSTYSKFMVAGAGGAGAACSGSAPSNVDVPIGRVVYTMLCNERGGIEMDPTVTRLAEDRFLVLAPTLAQRRTEMLLRNGAARPATVVTDVTSGWATLHLAGPRSRELLSRLTDEDLGERRVPVPVGTRDRGGLRRRRGRSASRSPESSAGSCRCRRSS